MAARNRLVIGIDPGNESAGLAVIRNGTLQLSRAVDPWAGGHNYLLAAPEDGIRIYTEVPRSAFKGKRASDSINAARGMIVKALLDGGYKFTQRNVKVVYPDQWRAHVFGRGVQRDTVGWKKLAFNKVMELYGIIPQTHDEAEAILIARYGWEQWEAESGKRARSKGTKRKGTPRGSDFGATHRRVSSVGDRRKSVQRDRGRSPSER